jgi:2-hydroxychromene-2-carboxylate isomerase
VKARVGLGAFIGIGLLVALALAFFVSPQASSKPDGLNKVAADQGFDDQEQAHALDRTPTAGYAVKGVDDDRLSTGLAGLIGVGVTFAITGGLFLVLKRTGRLGRGAPTTSPG